MAAEQAVGIVLRTVEFSESSVVATLFTREFGKISGLAKGGRRLKSAFDSALDLMAVCRIVFLRKSPGALDLLTEAKLLRRFRLSGRSLLGLYAGYYVLELLSELTHQYDPNPELFDLTDHTLLAVENNSHVAEHVLRFELGALSTLGYLPSLETCVGCGRHVPPEGKIWFGLVDGGVLCSRCRSGRRNVMTIRPATLAALAALSRNEAKDRPHEMDDARVQGELRGLINLYLRNLLGRKPRMHEYLGLLN